MNDTLDPIHMVNPPVKKAVDCFEKEETKKRNALDLGCGRAWDTLYLLKKGWSVWAVDTNDRSVKGLLADPEFKSRFTYSSQNYYALDWALVPPMDLILLLYTTSMDDVKKFKELIQNCYTKIATGGRFIGTFTSNLTKQEVLDLFKDFYVEALSCENKDKSYGFLYWYGILAQKRILGHAATHS